MFTYPIRRNKFNSQCRIVKPPREEIKARPACKQENNKRRTFNCGKAGLHDIL
jgi:hypothetical protein